MSELSFYEGTLGCVHCGLCQAACPTYQTLGLESDSPRGRIALARGLAEGRIEAPATIRKHFDQCLGCLACESACPSGVSYGKILEATRGHLEERWPAKSPRKRLTRILLARILTHQPRLRLTFRLARVAEVIGLRFLAAKIGLVSPLTNALVPRIPPAETRRPVVGDFEPETTEIRGTVAFFTGCVMEQVFGDLNRKTIALLLANGYRVRVPAQQVCCGALLLHDGQLDSARRLAELNTRAFQDADVVLHNSAGCGAAMKDYGHLLKGQAAQELADKTRDVCEFLADVGLTKTPQPFPYRVAYDDPCHLCHGQGIRSQPRDLLRQVPDLELAPHPQGETCCGSAGIYNLQEPHLAAEIGRAKIAALSATGADVVATGNPGCIMQIRAHLEQAGSKTRVVHPVELLL